MAWAIVAAVLAFFTLLPVAGMAMAWAYFAYRTAQGYKPPLPLPEVAVLLPLRGADPSLEACLKGLLAQDYPAYRVHVVIDSDEDPAQAVVARILAAAGPAAASVHVETRRILGTDCSAKLSAQRQALAALDDEVGVIAFLDADCIPSPDWLRELVAPFSDPRVGAATGVRWSAPRDDGWGTLVRYVFYGVAFPQHFLYRIPWGGSLAIRRSAVESTGLLEHWTHCLCEDTSAYGRLRRAGLRLAFVPAATQVNSEADRSRWRPHLHPAPALVRAAASRLLADDARDRTSRRSSRSWSVACSRSSASSASCSAAFGVATGLWKLAAFAIIPALYCVGLLLALAVGDRLVRRAVGAPPPPRAPKVIAAAAIAAGIPGYAMLAAPFVRSIEWRGITYDIAGRDRIRMRSYRPYHAAGTAPRSIV